MASRKVIPNQFEVYWLYLLVTYKLVTMQEKCWNIGFFSYFQYCVGGLGAGMSNPTHQKEFFSKFIK